MALCAGQRGSEHANSTMGRDKSTLYKVTIVRVLIPGSETCNGARSTLPLWTTSAMPGDNCGLCFTAMRYRTKQRPGTNCSWLVRKHRISSFNRSNVSRARSFTHFNSTRSSDNSSTNAASTACVSTWPRNVMLPHRPSTWLAKQLS